MYFLLQNVCPEMGRLKACDKENVKVEIKGRPKEIYQTT